MPSVTQILDQRQTRRKKHRRATKPRLAFICAALLSLALALSAILATVGYVQLSQDLPTVEDLPQFFEPPNGLLLQPTRFYDRSGEHLLLVIQNPKLTPTSFTEETISAFRRNYLPFPTTASGSQPASTKEFLPDNVISATIAIADPEFWNHIGFTLTGFFKPEQKTLAQQLVSALLLNEEPPGRRKELRARLLAAQATSRFGREKILEWYLNSAAYGRFSYGIDEAARLYFDKRVSQLSLAEAALLAGVSQSPSLNPYDAPTAALQRQKAVIQEMLRLRLISPQAGLQAASESLNLSPITQPHNNLIISDLQPSLAPAFINLAVAELDSILPRSRLEAGGFAIYTTLDYQLQEHANCLIAAKQTQQRDVRALNPTTTSLTEYCQTKEYLQFEPEKTSLVSQTEAMVLDPKNGQVLAFASDPTPRLQAGFLPAHPAGSLGTPFIYLTAFTRGLSPASLVWDTPFETTALTRNSDNLYHGPLRIRIAMANDYLIPAQKILEMLGLENIQQIIHQFGFYPSEPKRPAPFTSENLLGDVDILQASRAFGIFANQGYLAGKENPPDKAVYAQDPASLTGITILQVKDKNQQDIYQIQESSNRAVISPQLVYLINHILSDEPARWASQGHPNPLETGYPLAVKSGQTLDGNNHWIIGYSPDLVMAVWQGIEKSEDEAASPSPSDLADTTASLWNALAQHTLQVSPGVKAFPAPAGIVSLSVCDPSGMLPDDDCPNTVNEIFLPGNEPVQTDNLFQSFAINRQSGHLATVFTPIDLIEQRVYMKVPDEEHAWVEQSGIPLPPQSYDIVPLAPPVNPELQIISPASFDIIRGEIDIEGLIALDELDFFRLQIGQGIHPESWTQLGEDFSQPDQQPALTNWDTTTLEGLYTIQLLAVRQDQSLQRATTLVTIDNQPPKITVQQPYPGEIISVSAYESLILRADVQDNLSIKKVDFYLDGKLLTARFISPYITAWKPTIGEHTLKIVATDQAGNQTSTETAFTIQ